MVRAIWWLFQIVVSLAMASSASALFHFISWLDLPLLVMRAQRYTDVSTVWSIVVLVIYYRDLRFVTVYLQPPFHCLYPQIVEEERLAPSVMRLSAWCHRHYLLEMPLKVISFFEGFPVWRFYLHGMNPLVHFLA